MVSTSALPLKLFATSIRPLPGPPNARCLSTRATCSPTASWPGSTWSWGSMASARSTNGARCSTRAAPSSGRRRSMMSTRRAISWWPSTARRSASTASVSWLVPSTRGSGFHGSRVLIGIVLASLGRLHRRERPARGDHPLGRGPRDQGRQLGSLLQADATGADDVGPQPQSRPQRNRSQSSRRNRIDRGAHQPGIRSIHGKSTSARWASAPWRIRSGCDERWSQSSTRQAASGSREPPGARVGRRPVAQHARRQRVERTCDRRNHQRGVEKGRTALVGAAQRRYVLAIDVDGTVRGLAGARQADADIRCLRLRLAR